MKIVLHSDGAGATALNDDDTPMTAKELLALARENARRAAARRQAHGRSTA